jgi:hypothetical protein
VDSLWECLWKLWKVCDWVKAVCLYCVEVLEEFVVVGDDFGACYPSFDEDAVVSYFAEDEVVCRVVVCVDEEASLWVLC